ncbi:MAG: CPBP family intramembrane metalloprotease [Candidatus Syntrophonatronum acetioxidans]|uniref:CPBP family intramembrane metalloprotease n=1 Tax=Candidatus Syntrophonatronum acetioxidans TaxID=1795816 RepID=A0A424YDL6_9FIRM|nr:MAG: CPBP family intramembrane metalloprotease [Candidatus Syntrophonatronum acetioxidans]
MVENNGFQFPPGEAGGAGRKTPAPGSLAKLLLFTFALLITIGSVVQVLNFEVGMFITQWLLILPPALWFLKRYKLDFVNFARFKSLDLKFVPTILILVVCAWITSMFVASALIGLLMNYGYEPLELIPPPETLGHLFIYYLVIAISAGVCEEVLFRGTIMPSLENQGHFPALMLSTLYFAFFHGSFTNLASIFFLGFIIGVVVIKTGSLLGGILYHFLNNALAVTYLYLASNYNLESLLMLDDYRVLILILLLALAGVFFGLRKLHEQGKGIYIWRDKKRWLPRGWLNWAAVIVFLLFVIMASLELLMGFGFLTVA